MRAAPQRPVAAITVDLDSTASHLQGYGFDAAPAGGDPVYSLAVPRLLDLFDELGLSATFFAVARDARRHATSLRRVVAAGHELASHTMTHPQPFSTLAPAALRREIQTSRVVLEDLTGRAVHGFRAPGWDVNVRILEMVAKSGYRYDSSAFPSPAVVAVRLLTRLRGRGDLLPLDLAHHLLSPPAIHRRSGRGWELAEAPLAVLPLLRVPFYHTAAFFLGRRAMNALAALHRRSGTPLHYQLHGVDLLSIDDACVDARLACHPGMRLTLEEKRRLLRERLSGIAEGYACTTLAGVVATSLGGEYADLHDATRGRARSMRVLTSPRPVRNVQRAPSPESRRPVTESA